jgi:apolipoprotein N-acyltransferase
VISVTPAWRGRLLALAAGTGAALAHPPFGLLPGLRGYALILRLADDARLQRSAFLRGWLAGCAYFAISMWWVAEAFFVDVRQAWMAPFAVALLAGGLALFWGAAAAVYRRLASRGVLRVLVFAGVFAGVEWLRGHVLTGLPWNLPGETWRAGSAVSQFASVAGAYGLTWLTLAIAATAAVAREGRKGRIAVAVALTALVSLYAQGAWRLAHARAQAPAAPLVRIVQPDVRQEAKYDPALFARIVGKYVTLTRTPSARTPDIVIWPEGAVPAAVNEYLAPGTWTLEAIGGALTPGQTLLVGAYRVAGPTYYTSLVAVRATLDPEGRTRLDPTAIYD